MLLRLQGEAVDETDEALLRDDPSGQLSAAEALPEDGIEEGDGEEGEGFLSSLTGPLIAGATFVPTFLAVFFGLSYLLGTATPAPTAGAAPTPAAAPVSPDLRGRATPPLSETVRDPFATPRLLDPPGPGVGRDPGQAPRDSKGEDVTPPAAVQPSVPAPEPALPPVSPRVAEPRAREPRAPEPRAAEPPRQTQAAAPAPAPEPAPTAEPRKGGGRDWTPAAAFTDREAAGRLASSIQQQGYPVEIRQDRGSTRPWVVWIGAQPRSGGDRRR